jgi:hypothetical protein
MDSFLHDFVKEFEALGTADLGFAWVEFYLKFFFSFMSHWIRPNS